MLAASTGQFFNTYMRKLLFLPPQASTYAVSVDHLHYFIFISTFVVSVLVGGAALVFFIKYRRRHPGTQGGKAVSGPLLEAIFVGTPLAFFLLWVGLGINVYLEVVSPPADSMDIYVMAKQWMWKFSYPDGPIAEGTLHVPVGRPVKLLMTSRDVIHSFYVPSFRAKRDVLPGRYTEYWFQVTQPGVYDIFCAEYCGTNHSYMRGQIVAMAPADFDAWFSAQKRGRTGQTDASDPLAQLGTSSDLAHQGEHVAAEQGCLKCHSVDGTPHIGPTWLGLYHRQEKLSDGSQVLVDEPYMTESMMAPAAKIVDGFEPVMPSFQGRITPPEIAAILEYIKTLRAPPLQAQPSERPVYELK